MKQIKVSYANLGVRKSRETGEKSPRFPKNNSKLEVVDFEKVFKNQVNLNPENGKGMDGMIFPLDLETLISIDDMVENSVEGNGLVFLDVDLNEDNDVRDKIFDNLEDINHLVGGWILAGCKTGHGLHIIGLGERMTADHYKEADCNALVMLAKAVFKLLNIDLRDYLNALDTHNSSMKQRFFLRYSDKVYWNDNVVPNLFKLTVKDMRKVWEDYPMIYKDRTSEVNDRRVKFQVTAEIAGIKNPDKVRYIEHTERWSLFDGLCACYETEEEVMEQWYRCAEMIPTDKHSTEFFKDEPRKNRWYRRFQDAHDANVSNVFNKSLLNEFGYCIGDMDYNQVTKINKIKFNW